MSLISSAAAAVAIISGRPMVSWGYSDKHSAKNYQAQEPTDVAFWLPNWKPPEPMLFPASFCWLVYISSRAQTSHLKHIGKIKALGLDRELNPGPPAIRTGVITAKLPRP